MTDLSPHYAKALANDIAYFERLSESYARLRLKLPAQDILAAVLKEARHYVH